MNEQMAGQEKGPTYMPEQFQYMQASVGPVGPRGSPGAQGATGPQGFQGKFCDV